MPAWVRQRRTVATWSKSGLSAGKASTAGGEYAQVEGGDRYSMGSASTDARLYTLQWELSAAEFIDVQSE